MQSTGWFTNRLSPVKKIIGRKLLMQQPAWDNNTWGIRHPQRPGWRGNRAPVPITPWRFPTSRGSSLSILKWGKLYLRPESGTRVEQLKVELPRLQYLLAVSGTYERPLRDLTFRGIRFSYTSWMGPSSNDGYADQQSSV